MDAEKREKAAETIREIQEFLDEVFGALGDSVVKGMMLALMSQEVLMDVVKPQPSIIPHPLITAPMRLTQASFGCPHMKNLAYKESPLCRWQAECSVTGEFCLNLPLGVDNFYECITYKAKRILDVNEKREKNTIPDSFRD